MANGDLVHYTPPIYLRVAIGTDLRVSDIVDVPAGAGKLYTVRWVERVHLGFSNEYFVGIVEQVPPPPASLLLEDGTDLLLEDGTSILLE